MYLTINGLIYRSRDQHQIIDLPSLTFVSGNFYALLGPNGAGKSTLLKILAGILNPLQGNICWNDRPVEKLNQLVAFVPQNPFPQFNFLVEELVAMGRYSHSKFYWKAASEPYVEEALMLVDALHLKKRSIQKLSQGELQRVYIARALAMQAPVMLLDEPTANLDIKNQMEVWNLLYRLSKQGKLIIMATHDLEKAERYCSQAAILKKGQCISIGSFNPMTIEEAFGIRACHQLIGDTP